MDEENQIVGKRVFQFKITLKGIKPPIWRRILVPETYSFWDLHVAIQSAMGWRNLHLHDFEIMNPKNGEIDTIGIITEEDNPHDSYLYDTCKKKIARYFSDGNRKAHYRYDFGDGWEHNIVLEKNLPKLIGEKYPQIIGGARMCPPEDCGGPYGYENFVAVMKNPEHPENGRMLAFSYSTYEPENWDLTQVSFDDPQLIYQQVFEPDAEFA